MHLKSEAQFQREVQRVTASLPQARAELAGIPGVVDVRVGIRTRAGMATQDVVFQVYVEHKKGVQEIAPEHRVPPVVAGFPTDVVALAHRVAEDVVLGGRTMTQENCAAAVGTLGGFALTTAANAHLPADTPVLLTNWHVAPAIGGAVGLDSLCDCRCCACCDIGRVVDSQVTTAVDAAIARLNSDVRFSHEIIEIGAIRGTGTAVIGTPIAKYGQTTHLTTGVVVQDNEPQYTRADNQTFNGQLRIAPVAPSTDMSEPGDSGSLYVNSTTRQVVGIHHTGGGPDAIGSHIAPVLALMNIRFPVMGTAGAIPLSAAAAARPRPTLLDAVAALRRELEASQAGRAWMELVRGHAEEVRHLVNHDRETRVAWHRSQGPAFVAHYLKSVREPGYRVPAEVGGARVENLVIAMAATLQRTGSPRLSGDVSEHYLSALQLVQGCDSAEGLVARARRWAGAGPAPLSRER